MKQIIVVACIFLAFASPGFCDGGGCDSACQTVNQVMDDAAEKWVAMSTDVITRTVESPDLSSLEDCLGSINGLDFSFGLSLPTIADLLDAACKFVRDTIDSQISSKTSQLSSEYSFDAYGLGGIDAAAGYGSDTEITYKVNDTSKEVIDSIWDAIQ